MEHTISEKEALVKDQLELAKQKIDMLKTKSGKRTKHSELLEKLQLFLNKGLTFSILRLLDQKELPGKAETFSPELLTAINEIQAVVRNEAIRKMNRFPALFEEVCNSNKIVFDWDSRYPRYNFFNGFLRLDVIESAGLARLSSTEGIIGEVPADMELIVELVLQEFRRLFDRPFDERRFLRKIRNQYLAIVKKENAPDGSSIHIRKITSRLGHNEKGFKNDEFIVDISKLLKSKNVDIHGKRLSFQQTKDTSKGLFIPGEFGGYVGFVQFTESNSKETS